MSIELGYKDFGSVGEFTIAITVIKSEEIKIQSFESPDKADTLYELKASVYKTLSGISYISIGISIVAEICLAITTIVKQLIYWG